MWDREPKPSVRLPRENLVILVGRLTRDPKAFTTTGGHEVCHFRIAANRSYKGGDEWREDVVFVPVTVWRALAKRCSSLTKGSAVRVEGRLHTAPGREGYPPSLEVQARRVEFLQVLPSRGAPEENGSERGAEGRGRQERAP